MKGGARRYVTVRNERGREMIDMVRNRLDIVPTMSTGDRRTVVMQVIAATRHSLCIQPTRPRG
jgi:hypothetical protein